MLVDAYSRLTLKAPIATKVVCFSCLLKYLRSLYDKKCGPRWDCSTLFASILKFVINVRQLFAADDFSRRHFSDSFFFGALRVKQALVLFLWFDSLCPSQQFCSYIGTNLFGLNQYLKQGFMCLAQEHNPVNPVKLEPATPRSRDKHSTTEPLRSMKTLHIWILEKWKKVLEFYFLISVRTLI